MLDTGSPVMIPAAGLQTIFPHKSKNYMFLFLSYHHKFYTSPNIIAVGACAKFVVILLYSQLQKYNFEKFGRLDG